ncbi:MAG: prephenate dehydrogenase [Acutalibacteraceae bacterium]
MNIAIVGMGIIGGSFAKAIKKYTSHTVIGINRSKPPLEKALKDKSIDFIGTNKDLLKADITILCIYPEAAVKFTKENGEFFKKGSIVTDSAGIKAKICPELEALSEKFGFTFIGCHPMAGKEKNGYDASSADLFNNASCIILPCKAEKEKVNLLSDFMLELKFGGIKITDPSEHDRMIAFTSQLPHVLACSYVLSPNCLNHNGFSAGSYRDVSRVANINAELWSELFLENKEPLLKELDTLIENIQNIESAIKSDDKILLQEILEKGHSVKEALGE